MNINDNINEKAFQIVDKLVAAGIIKDCTDTDDQTEFEAQDIIAELLTEEQTAKESTKQVFLGEIVTKFVAAENPRDVQIRSSRDASNLLREIIGDNMQVRQQLVAIYLNNANKVMSVETITTGTSKQVLMDGMRIAKEAIITGASGVIVAHNHPSGNERPSESDKRETKSLKAALDYLEVSFLDNIILTEDTYYSFADNGERSLS